MNLYFFRGDYNQYATYAIDDSVWYESKLYGCKVANTKNIAPTGTTEDNTNWKYLSSTRSTFPTTIDAFQEVLDMPPEQATNVARYQVLLAKTDKTQAEWEELTGLTKLLQSYMITPIDWNRFQDSVYNMEIFVKDKITNYYVYQGDWVSGTAYEILNSVLDTEENGGDGNVYFSKVEKESLNKTLRPSANTSQWTVLSKKGSKGDKGDKGDNGVGVQIRGSWNIATTYSVDDAVEYLGSLYACISSNTGMLPTNTAYWVLIVTKGFSAQITQLTNTYTLPIDRSYVDVNVDNYTPSTDTLIVFVNSVYAAKTVEYTLDTNLRRITKTSGTWALGSIFDFVVLKNVYTDMVFQDGALILENSVDGTKIIAKSITNSQITDGTITEALLATALAGKINTHASRHAYGGADVITPASIGAVSTTEIGVITNNIKRIKLGVRI